MQTQHSWYINTNNKYISSSSTLKPMGTTLIQHVNILQQEERRDEERRGETMRYVTLFDMQSTMDQCLNITVTMQNRLMSSVTLRLVTNNKKIYIPYLYVNDTKGDTSVLYEGVIQ